jgi:hypothetical protein
MRGGRSSDDSSPSRPPRYGPITLWRLLVVSGVCAALLLGLIWVGSREENTPVASNTIPGDLTAEVQRQPPFRLFAMWLDAFNSGDPQRYSTFLRRIFPFRGAALSEDLQLRERTGGFDVLKVTHESATQVTGWLRERGSRGQLVQFELTLELYLQAGSIGTRIPATPYRIVGIELRGGSVPTVRECFLQGSAHRGNKVGASSPAPIRTRSPPLLPAGLC